MHRRTACVAAVAAALAGTARAAVAAPARRPAWGGVSPRRLRLRHAATGAAFTGTYHNGLAPDPVAMRELSLLLADTRSGTVHDFDPRAIDILWELGERERMGEFTVLSGYRTPHSNAIVEGAADSQHLRAAALDLMLPAARLQGFGTTALALGKGGVGVYQAKGFIHIDSGPVRRWGDVPGGGGSGSGARKPAPQDPLSRMAEAWAATRGRR
jgi:uncharacterized protein YcbK (DUF882 family)